MKKDFGGIDEFTGSTSSTSKLWHQGEGITRADWAESSKIIAKDSDDFIFSELQNLEAEKPEWLTA